MNFEDIMKFDTHNWINAIDDFKYPSKGKGKWKACPRCDLKPKIWIYDNGRTTACGCWNSIYDHFSVEAESIMSVHRRTEGKRMDKYDTDELRKNWNKYCSLAGNKT